MPGPFANGLVVALPGPTSESVIPDRLQAPSEREARSPATTSAAWAVNRNFEDDTFMGNVLAKALADRGHEVVRCSSAEEAWDVCQREIALTSKYSEGALDFLACFV